MLTYIKLGISPTYLVEKEIDKMRYLPDTSWFQQGSILSWGEGEFHLGYGELNELPKGTVRENLFYATDFDLSERKPWKEFLKIKSLSFEDLTHFLDPFPDESLFWEWTPPSYEKFQASFLGIQEEIKKGFLEKAVPYFFEKAQMKSPIFPIATLIKKVLTKERLKNRHLYGFWTQGKGFLGLTPEVLFEKKDSSLKTMSLAGTSWEGDAIIEDKKELKEHDFVTRDLEKKLAPLGKRRKGFVREMNLEGLKHLRTDIEVLLDKDRSFENLVESLHPTSALATFPSLASLNEKLSFWDEGERLFFGAPFGFFKSPKEQKAVVSIRGIQWKDSQVFLGSGCGIVKQSVLKKEWKELQMKRLSIKRDFDL